jgi:DNA-binding MarR family transcriptional regulator
MTEIRGRHADAGRTALEANITVAGRALTSASDAIGRVFARKHNLSRHDFSALLHIMMAETAGTPLTSGQLREQMEVSAPAITYLVDRMIDTGHIRRETDKADRRRVLLRCRARGLGVAQRFFTRLGSHTAHAMAHLPENDLIAAHRVFTALNEAMAEFGGDQAPAISDLPVGRVRRKPDRTSVESLISADLRAFSAGSDRIGYRFAELFNLRPEDGRALLHILVGETSGTPVTSGQLRARMGLSGAAMAQLVERITGSGHVGREEDPHDRRKVVLRYSVHGRDAARRFFAPLAERNHTAMRHLSDSDLAAAHRVFLALIEAMAQFRAELAPAT